MDSDDSTVSRMSWLKLKVEGHWRKIDKLRLEDEEGNQLLIAMEINRLLRVQAVLDHFIYN